MTQQLSSALQRFAQALAEARAGDGKVAEAPPIAGYDEAMAAQAEVTHRMGETVAGWKITLDKDRGALVAPMHRGFLSPSGARFACPHDLAVEVELAVRLGRDLAVGEQDRASVAAAFESWCVGIELCSTRVAGGQDPFLPFLVDGLAHYAYATGAWSPWREVEATGRRCLVRLDGEALHDAPATASQGDPVSVVLAALQAPTVLRGGFKAGQVITTGSRCGAVKAPGAQGHLVCELEGLGVVEAQLVQTRAR
jgi:2-keto-4-pentenoate hydratase